jgi:peptidoglycan/LPS O-acetylase OafA/YrhL
MLKNTQKVGYIAGLDGLRAFAVLAVLAYHFGFGWARGGFLGVDIFFVISGYLITSILLPEQDGNLNVSLKEFWVGRIRRLIPAAYTMIGVTFLWVLLFRQDLLHTVRGDAAASLLYTSNWWFIFHKLSYFDSFGSPSPLKNLWSLAIEEQFYLIWPLILMLALKRKNKHGSHIKIVFTIVLSSAILMALLYQPGEDPSRVYYGTDTRCFELLIGGLLAMIIPMRKLAAISAQNGRKRLIDTAGTVAFAVFILSVASVDEYQSFLYRGGLLLFCLNSAVLIFCTCCSGSFLGRLLSWKPLRWIGTRSYGIYLWHYPVTVLSTPVYQIGHPSLWRVAVQIAVTFLIAELSYRLIEIPVRRLGFSGFVQKHFSAGAVGRRKPVLKRISTATSMVIVLCLMAYSIGSAEKGAGSEPSGKTDQIVSSSIEPSKPVNAVVSESAVQVPASSEGAISDGTPEKMPEQGNGEVQEQDAGEAQEPAPIENGGENEGTAENSYEQVLSIGDSIMIDISSSLKEKYKNITIDARVGRQMSQACEIAPRYASFNQPNKAVIIELGTNGYFTENQFDRLLDNFTKSRIYLINTRVPRPWEFKVNDALEKKAEERENVQLIDWYSEAVNHTEYFSSDGVHLTKKGVQALTSLINQAFASDLSSEKELAK